MHKFVFHGTLIRGRAIPFSPLHGFNCLALYSTVENPPKTDDNTFAKYLVKSLGFTQHQSVSTSTKLARYRLAQGALPTKVSDFNSFSENVKSVVSFLKSNGLDVSQLRTTIIKEPRVLLSDVDKTIKPKVTLLSELGFSGSDLAHLISRNPSIILLGLSLIIKALREILGNNDDYVMTFIKRMGHIGWASIKNITQNASLLEKSYGIPTDRLQKFIAQQPQAFLQTPESFRAAVTRVGEKWGTGGDAAIFLHAICRQSNLSAQNIDRKCEMFKSFGWTDSDVMAIIRSNPNVLTSSEARIKRLLEFYMNKLGYGPAYLAAFSSLFTYSLEKRVAPRHRLLQVLKDQGLLRTDYSLYQAVCLTELKFLEKFIHPYKSDVPGLHESYTSSVTAAVQSSGHGKVVSCESGMNCSS